MSGNFLNITGGFLDLVTQSNADSGVISINWANAPMGVLKKWGYTVLWYKVGSVFGGWSVGECTFTLCSFSKGNLCC